MAKSNTNVAGMSKKKRQEAYTVPVDLLRADW